MPAPLAAGRAARRDPPHEYPIATFEVVDIRRSLEARPLRSPNYEQEHQTIARLASEVASNAHSALQKLAEAAVSLCSAHTAGISLLDGDLFRWEAVAGVFAAARGGTFPRAASPCGVCIDRDSTQLMHLPDRCFPALYAEPRFVEMLLVPFHDHGRPIGTLWIASHSADREFNREDERIVRILAQYASAAWQLWTAHQAAADSNRRKDRLLATLGHELRNPLAAIAAATSILERHVTPGGAAAHALDVIARQTQHVGRLADDLLESSRLRSGKVRLDVKPVNLWSLVVDSVEMCRWRLEQRRLGVSVVLPSKPAYIDGDAVRLAQVFSNLIDNAAKFTPEDGKVTIDGGLDDRFARVSITDTGAGIPRDQLQRIFEPFAQIAELHDASAGGLGLGLSLVRSLSELHGGTVTVASDGAGRGSCFTVRLPVAANGAADPGAVAALS